MQASNDNELRELLKNHTRPFVRLYAVPGDLPYVPEEGDVMVAEMPDRRRVVIKVIAVGE